MRSPGLFALAAIPLLGVGPVANAGDPARGEKEVLDQLQKGQTADALALAVKLRDGLPLGARLTRWRLDLGPRARVVSILTGQRHVYVATYWSRQGTPWALGMEDKRPALTDHPTGYDFHEVIYCVDARTGKKLWARQ